MLSPKLQGRPSRLHHQSLLQEAACWALALNILEELRGGGKLGLGLEGFKRIMIMPRGEGEACLSGYPSFDLPIYLLISLSTYLY